MTHAKSRCFCGVRSPRSLLMRLRSAMSCNHGNRLRASYLTSQGSSPCPKETHVGDRRLVVAISFGELVDPDEDVPNGSVGDHDYVLCVLI
jgi:hypothetical protein